MTALRISESLELPIDAVTEPLGIFANRGKGKSNVAHRFVEQLYLADLPSVVLDIKGDWYGIRSSADGKAAGFPFLIFGGAHADVVLTPDSGTHVAHFLAEHRVPSIVDLSEFSKTVARRWVMEFAEELYRVNTEPLMVVVDEADVLIPQRLSNDLMRLLGAMEDIAKRGRQRGLGITVISQRVADVNKAVTDLLETLFLLAVTGTRTRKAILEWIDDHADPDEAKAVVATLSSLDPGEGWVWSPGWLRILQRVRFLRPDTFDSHATPKAGERRRSINTMADVDLAAIKEQMADTIEKAKADDPKELRRRIVALERQLADRPAETVEVERVVEVVRDVVPEGLLDALLDVEGHARQLADAVARAIAAGTDLPVATAAALARPEGGEPRARTPNPRSPSPLSDERRERRSAPAARPVSDSAAGDGAPSIGKAERAILAALVQKPDADPDQLAILAGYHKRSKGYMNALGALRSAGLLDGIRITAAGQALADQLGIEPIGDLWQHWYHHPKVDGTGRKILDALAAAWPDSLDRVALAEACGYHERSKGFMNALGRLRSLELVTRGSEIRLTDDFGEAVSG